MSDRKHRIRRTLVDYELWPGKHKKRCMHLSIAIRVIQFSYRGCVTGSEKRYRVVFEVGLCLAGIPT